MTTPENSTSAYETDPVSRQRREIENTRTDMGRTLERIENKVSPSQIKQRQVDRIRGRVTTIRDSVMGSAKDASDEAKDRLSDATDSARDAVTDAPHQVEDATRGNPMAAGLIAAGVGALLGSLLPTTKPERRIAHNLRDEFEEPLRSELQDVGRELTDELQLQAREGAEAVKSAARDSMEKVNEEAKGAAQNVRDEATGDTNSSSSAMSQKSPTVQ